MSKNSTTATMLDSYVNTAIRNYVREYDESNDFPREIWDNLANDMKIFSPILSEKNHTLSPDFITFIRKIANEFAALSAILLTQGCYGIYSILNFGTAEQKELYLEKLLKGNCIAGLGFCEYKHLNGLEDLETYATKTEQGWYLSGKKAMISNSSVADILLILAKVKEQSKEETYGLFIVDPNDSDVLIGEQIEKSGLIGLPLSSVTLENVLLPKHALLGGELLGDVQFANIIKNMQLGLSAIALGIAEGAFKKGLEFAKVKREFGKRLIDVEVHQHKFADLYNKLCSAEAYFDSYPSQIEEDAKFVSRIKLYTTKVAIEISDEIIRLIGPFQKFDKINIRRYLKDAEIIENYGRSGNSIRREIAERWLKE
ncbi:acyl-CoA dehydrogenase family protein [Streptococcus constellatus]|uniref:acyl-CoA dehydrogenase family protein n=1 Tax=Streptococcus constellatus TaxID=76860 RepID=UPI00189C03FF|nr:acyl-CoA dehydrogenase family protein [Streptococcus constellatus]